MDSSQRVNPLRETYIFEKNRKLGREYWDQNYTGWTFSLLTIICLFVSVRCIGMAQPLLFQVRAAGLAFLIRVIVPPIVLIWKTEFRISSSLMPSYSLGREGEGMELLTSFSFARWLGKRERRLPFLWNEATHYQSNSISPSWWEYKSCLYVFVL